MISDLICVSVNICFFSVYIEERLIAAIRLIVPGASVRSVIELCNIVVFRVQNPFSALKVHKTSCFRRCIVQDTGFLTVCKFDGGAAVGSGKRHIRDPSDFLKVTVRDHDAVFIAKETAPVEDKNIVFAKRKRTRAVLDRFDIGGNLLICGEICFLHRDVSQQLKKFLTILGEEPVIDFPGICSHAAVGYRRIEVIDVRIRAVLNRVIVRINAVDRNELEVRKVIHAACVEIDGIADGISGIVVIAHGLQKLAHSGNLLVGWSRCHGLSLHDELIHHRLGPGSLLALKGPDLGIIAADPAPVADFSGINVYNLLLREVIHRIAAVLHENQCIPSDRGHCEGLILLGIQIIEDILRRLICQIEFILRAITDQRVIAVVGCCVVDVCLCLRLRGTGAQPEKRVRKRKCCRRAVNGREISPGILLIMRKPACIKICSQTKERRIGALVGISFPAVRVLPAAVLCGFTRCGSGRFGVFVVSC